MNPPTERNPGSTRATLTADIMILGAGYGGLHVAQRLTNLLGSARKPDGSAWTIFIVDRQNHHQLTTELPRLVNNEVTDDSVAIPLKRLLNEQRVRLLQAEVRRIKLGLDTRPSTVETSAGTLTCRHLVIALGSVSNDFGIPGVRAYPDDRGHRAPQRRRLAAAERVLRPMTRNAVSVGRGHGAANLLGVTLEGKAALALKDLIEWEYRQSITHFHGYSLATIV